MLIALIIGYLFVQAGLALFIYRFRARLKYKSILVLALLVALVSWTYLVRDSALLCKIAPNKYGVVIYDLFPLIVSAIFALFLTMSPRILFRSMFYGMLWSGMNAYIFGAAFYSPLQCGNKWKSVCCLQTTASTCAPAAAATLLKLHGIDAREDEMTRTCLTNTNGTTFWGMYHGLRERTDAAGKSVEVGTIDCDAFLAQNEPAVVFVMLTREADNLDKRYANDWGWNCARPAAHRYGVGRGLRHAGRRNIHGQHYSLAARLRALPQSRANRRRFDYRRPIADSGRSHSHRGSARGRHDRISPHSAPAVTGFSLIEAKEYCFRSARYLETGRFFMQCVNRSDFRWTYLTNC